MIAGSVALAACNGSTTGGTTSTGPSTDTDLTGFISANPLAPLPAPPGVDATGGGAGGAAPADDDDGNYVVYVIEAADLVQVDGGKLYALSRYGGLSVVDVSRPEHPSLLGQRRSSGRPFEMVVRDGVVYALFSSAEERVPGDGSEGPRTVNVSRVEALDVADPTDIRPLGSLALPGTLTDVHLVGDVLYAVTAQDGACWGCTGDPNTTVTSLSIADPTAIHVVDELRYDVDASAGYRRGPSTVSATQERLYVSGALRGASNPRGRSNIQVIDISDPGGDLVGGAMVGAHGLIESPWQMDEHAGVLRVISQPGFPAGERVPSVQTFSVASSAELAPLATTELRSPQAERLLGVRFDGDRAYAATAQAAKTLFTIDLSDPASPALRGEIALPAGGLYLEPRGDRLLTVGPADRDADGSLGVSLLDVSDLAAPTVLDHVAFGDHQASVGDDWTRIHRAFAVLDALGAIVVPYESSEVVSQEGAECDVRTGGVQLIDFTGDTLTKRGVARHRAPVRRALVHEGQLLAFDGEQLAAFDLADRDAPAELAEIPFAMDIRRTRVVGDVVARLVADWPSYHPRLEVVPLSDPGRVEPLGALDLTSVLVEAAPWSCGSTLSVALHMFTHGQHLYLLWLTSPGAQDRRARLAVIDVSEPAAPRIASQLDLPFGESPLYFGLPDALLNSGDSVVQAGSTLVLLHGGVETGVEGSPGGETPWLTIVDIANPARPTISARVSLPAGAGRTRLLLDGTTVLTSHWTPLPGDPSKARFYFDRVDVSDPSSPVVSAPINVPGSLLLFDRPSSRLLTTDYERIERPASTSGECSRSLGNGAKFVPAPRGDSSGGGGTCLGFRRTLKLVDIDGASATLRDASPIDDAASGFYALVGDDRAFMPITRERAESSGNGDRDGTERALLVAGGLRDGAIRRAERNMDEFEIDDARAVDGARLVLVDDAPASLSVLDATDLDNMTLGTPIAVSGDVREITLHGGVAICSLGMSGVEVVDLGP
ncbi:beta-propeller domain-containing protein [Sorangium sp. So ce375]|uniref:beta-propeller domain-containing protein n=1 Tax=Sorangium sp. So ce375 TaxID=3133306 RepID=UPI003F5AF4D9